MNKITKAKLTKGRTLEVELIEINDDKTENEVTKKCSQLAHNDLLVVFDKLKLHLAKLCDLYEGRDVSPDSFDTENDLKNFTVSSFSISGNDDQEGVTISGLKRLGSGKVINLNTPFQKYADEIDEYQFAGELNADVLACIYEVEQYLFEGKYAIKQLEIDFEQGEGSEGEFEKVEKPKRAKKEKVINMFSTEQKEADVLAAM